MKKTEVAICLVESWLFICDTESEVVGHSIPLSSILGYAFTPHSGLRLFFGLAEDSLLLQASMQMTRTLVTRLGQMAPAVFNILQVFRIRRTPCSHTSVSLSPYPRNFVLILATVHLFFFLTSYPWTAPLSMDFPLPDVCPMCTNARCYVPTIFALETVLSILRYPSHPS